MFKGIFGAALALLSPLTLATAPALLSSATTAEAKPNQSEYCGSDSYINSRGNCVPRPRRAPTAPAGATAKCRDGTYSFSQSRRGTCSHHGGVATWL
jgi:hypothetical protein